MLNEWGTWQKTVWEQWGMDPVIIDILTKNIADVEAIVSIIGLQNFFRMLPHVVSILKTVQADKGKR